MMAKITFTNEWFDDAVIDGDYVDATLSGEMVFDPEPELTVKMGGRCSICGTEIPARGEHGGFVVTCGDDACNRLFMAPVIGDRSDAVVLSQWLFDRRLLNRGR